MSHKERMYKLYSLTFLYFGQFMLPLAGYSLDMICLDFNKNWEKAGVLKLLTGAVLIGLTVQTVALNGGAGEGVFSEKGAKHGQIASQ